jgi:Protein of unknown function (DUF998)
MTKICLVVFCIIATQFAYAQNRSPVVLRSNTRTIEIIMADGKGAWHVDPGFKPDPDSKPDVLLLERSFHAQTVKYKSDIDSITFLVKPGDHYEFTILINNQESFRTGIATAALPVFLQTDVLATVFISLLLIAAILYRNRKKIATEKLLYLGVLSPALFWLLTIIGGFIHGDYNHLRMVVSELGAIGTRSEIFMSTGELVLGIISTLSVIGFCSACRQNGISIIPPLTILTLSFSMIWAAIFPMRHELHGSTGPLPLIMFAGALLAVFLWRKKELTVLRRISLLSFIIMMLFLFRIYPNIRNHFEGMLQRFFYLGWTVWSAGMSLVFLRRARKVS